MSHLKKKADFRRPPRQLRSNNSQWQSKNQSHPKNQVGFEECQTLYQSLPCIYFALNLEGKIIFSSEFGAHYLGYEVAELSQKSADEVFDRETSVNCSLKFRELQQQPTQTIQWESRLIGKNQTLIWVRVRARLVVESQSNPIISLVCEDITAHQQMQEALRKSQELFQSTFEQAAVGMSHCDLTGHFLKVNQKFCELVGYTEEELLTVTFQDITCADDLELSLGYVRSLLAREIESYAIEKRYIRKDGAMVWGHQTVSLARNVLGEPEYFVAVVEDITERKRTDQMLRLANFSFERYAIPAVWIKRDASVVRVNEAACRVLGYSHEEFQSMHVYDIDPDFPPEVWPEHWQALKQQQTITFVSRHRTKDGRIIPVELTLNYLEFNGEEYNFAFARDITERQQAELALRESEKRFRLLAENATDIISQHSPDGRYLYVSPACRSLLGYEPEELLGNSPYELFHPEDIPAIAKSHSTILESSVTYTVAYRMRRKDGGYIWVETTSRTLRNPDTQEILEIHAASRDITDRKQAEEALRQSEARLRLALEAAHMGTWDWNMVTNEGLYCDQLARLFGLPPGIPHLTFEDFINQVHPDDRNALAQAVTRAIQQGTDYEIEFRIVWPDGSVHWVGNKGQVYYDKSGNPTRMVGVVMDSTERKNADDTLQQQFQRERLISAIAGRIHQSLNLKEILNTTVAEVRQFLECDRVIIFRLHEDGSGVVVVESVGLDWLPMSGTVIHDCYLAQQYVQLYQQGRVQAVDDIYTADLTDCHRDLLAQFQVRANLVVPIVHEERLWGLLVAQQCSGSRQWQPLEIDLLKSLSTQAAIAIQQSELYQQAQTEILQRQQAEDALKQQFQRERLVGAIAGRIRKSLKLEKILNATVAEVRQVLQTDRVIIFRFQPDWSGHVTVESVTSKEFSILGQKIYDPCFHEAFIKLYQQGRVKAIEDIYKAHLSPCHVELLEKLQVRSNLIVPILQSEPTLQNSKSKNQNQLWGLLIAHHCSSPRQWQQWEMDLLSALASQVAIAIHQSQLYEQAQALAKREQALNQVTQAIRSSLDLETIFATTVQKIGELLQVDRVHIVQYLPARKVWFNVCEYRQLPDSLTTLGREIPDEPNGITERLKRLEIVKIHDTEACEHLINQNLAKTFPGAWLVVPLSFNASVWGSLGLIKNEPPYYWQDYEVELICAVADQVAIAIQQAELYQQSRTATAQARTQAQQLEQTLIELQKTQAHLVQTEKMSSLGQLVAGVAHEINNPVSFIYGNLTHASGYTQDLLGLVELYQQHYPQPVARIQEQIEVIDLEFLMEDMPKLLSSMKVGAERICEIVSALRTFSRVAEAEMKAIDLHEGLDSTLMILQNRLKASGKHPEIQVIKEYGLLPKVECYAGQLNQVFMNLLVNAIDAIDEHNQKRSPEEIQANPSFIRVRTELLNENEIAIHIADNGLGMTPSVQARLFDPFFTTKPVGAGTGLGLSISYQIVVEKHGGKFYCCSELGKGTEFVIHIPLSQGVS